MKEEATLRRSGRQAQRQAAGGGDTSTNQFEALEVEDSPMDDQHDNAVKQEEKMDLMKSDLLRQKSDMRQLSGKMDGLAGKVDSMSDSISSIVAWISEQRSPATPQALVSTPENGQRSPASSDTTNDTFATAIPNTSAHPTAVNRQEFKEDAKDTDIRTLIDQLSERLDAIRDVSHEQNLANVAVNPRITPQANQVGIIMGTEVRFKDKLLSVDNAYDIFLHVSKLDDFKLENSQYNVRLISTLEPQAITALNLDRVPDKRWLTDEVVHEHIAMRFKWKGPVEQNMRQTQMLECMEKLTPNFLLLRNATDDSSIYRHTLTVLKVYLDRLKSLTNYLVKWYNLELRMKKNSALESSHGTKKMYQTACEVVVDQLRLIHPRLKDQLLQDWWNPKEPGTWVAFLTTLRAKIEQHEESADMDAQRARDLIDLVRAVEDKAKAKARGQYYSDRTAYMRLKAKEAKAEGKGLTSTHTLAHMEGHLEQVPLDEAFALSYEDQDVINANVAQEQAQLFENTAGRTGNAVQNDEQLAAMGADSRTTNPQKFRGGCVEYLVGCCNHGDSCRYSHDIDVMDRLRQDVDTQRQKTAAQRR